MNRQAMVEALLNYRMLSLPSS
jgi:hypothetical protein